MRTALSGFGEVEITKTRVLALEIALTRWALVFDINDGPGRTRTFDLRIMSPAGKCPGSSILYEEFDLVRFRQRSSLESGTKSGTKFSLRLGALGPRRAGASSDGPSRLRHASRLTRRVSPRSRCGPRRPSACPGSLRDSRGSASGSHRTRRTPPVTPRCRTR